MEHIIEHKKKNSRTNTSILITASCLMFFTFCLETGCRKFVEIPPPTSQLVTASVFNNNASATSAITDIYTQMFGGGSVGGESVSIAFEDGLLADELTNYNLTFAANYTYYRNAMAIGLNGGLYGEWQYAYNYIYQANAVISGLKQYPGTSTAVKNQLTGEAYFIRAFWHFYLTNTYGPVPVALTTDYTVIERLSRTSRIQVLQQVITDLNQAELLLSNNYVDASDTASTVDRVRPNKAVAQALLARAYLYLANYNNNDVNSYKNAYDAANAVIMNQKYSLCANLSGPNSVFLANSTEAIWQLYTPLPTSANTADGNYFILQARPTTVAISPQLLSAFEPGDQRKVNWIDTITEDTSTYYFPYKYKGNDNNFTGTVTEYTMVLRLAEQYLIRAEAQANDNSVGQGLSGAISDLDAIRNRAGLPNYSGAYTQAAVLTAILHERQVELFTEWGARWYDLNRAVHTVSTVNVNTVMSVVTPLKGGTWSNNGNQELYPIPLTDIEKDPNLTQNAGY